MKFLRVSFNLFEFDLPFSSLHWIFRDERPAAACTENIFGGATVQMEFKMIVKNHFMNDYNLFTRS